jgi:hypothetical protein
MELKLIQEIARNSGWFFTDHAVRQMAKRDITDVEVSEAVLSGEIIEEYPDDKYSPSCLIYGRTNTNKHLHVLCSSPPRVRVVTVYEPDETEWVNHRVRR